MFELWLKIDWFGCRNEYVSVVVESMAWARESIGSRLRISSYLLTIVLETLPNDSTLSVHGGVQSLGVVLWQVGVQLAWLHDIVLMPLRAFESGHEDLLAVFDVVHDHVLCSVHDIGRLGVQYHLHLDS